MWRLPGVEPRLRRAELSFGPPATLIALLGLLTFAPACACAASQDAPQESDGSDPGRSALAAGRFIDALRIWWPRAEHGDARAAFGLGLLYDLGEGVGQNAPAAFEAALRSAGGEPGDIEVSSSMAVRPCAGVPARIVSIYSTGWTQAIAEISARGATSRASVWKISLSKVLSIARKRSGCSGCPSPMSCAKHAGWVMRSVLTV